MLYLNTTQFLNPTEVSNQSALPEIFKINAAHFARQITLIELEKFKALKPEEFKTFKWTGVDKEKYAPNIVASTRWFNQLNLWVQKEILGQIDLSTRSDVLSHFINIAQELVIAKNFSSSMAIMSALQTEAIFRLRKTWVQLTEDSKNTYRRLESIFSQSDNSSKLRSCTEKCPLPIIPYLGMYLSELVYINTAHARDIGGKPTSIWLKKMNEVLEKIAFYQQSTYSYQRIEKISQYLLSQSYVENIRRFTEEENFRISLRLEPRPNKEPDKSPLNLTDREHSRPKLKIPLELDTSNQVKDVDTQKQGSISSHLKRPSNFEEIEKSLLKNRPDDSSCHESSKSNPSVLDFSKLRLSDASDSDVASAWFEGNESKIRLLKEGPVRARYCSKSGSRKLSINTNEYPSNTCVSSCSKITENGNSTDALKIIYNEDILEESTIGARLPPGFSFKMNGNKSEKKFATLILPKIKRRITENIPTVPRERSSSVKNSYKSASDFSPNISFERKKSLSSPKITLGKFKKVFRTIKRNKTIGPRENCWNTYWAFLVVIEHHHSCSTLDSRANLVYLMLFPHCGEKTSCYNKTFKLNAIIQKRWDFFQAYCYGNRIHDNKIDKFLKQLKAIIDKSFDMTNCHIEVLSLSLEHPIARIVPLKGENFDDALLLILWRERESNKKNTQSCETNKPLPNWEPLYLCMQPLPSEESLTASKIRTRSNLNCLPLSNFNDDHLSTLSSSESFQHKNTIVSSWIETIQVALGL